MRKIAIATHAQATHTKCHEGIFHLVQIANQVQSELNFQRVRLSRYLEELFAKSPLDFEDGRRLGQTIKTEQGLNSDDILIVVVDGNLQDDEDDEYFSMCGIDAGATAEGIAILSLY